MSYFYNEKTQIFGHNHDREHHESKVHRGLLKVEDHKYGNISGEGGTYTY